MTAQEQISRLQGLLARIQKNAGGPRPSAPLASSATAPPTGFAAHPAPPPVAFASPAALPVAPPPSHTVTPPMPYAVSVPVPAPSAADQSVDDLLGPPSADNSGLPVDVDIPFDTIPPVAAAPATTPPGEEEAIPLVAVAPQQPAPPPSDDALGLDSEVSEVRMAPSVRDSDVEVTVAAIEAEAETISTEELSEADLVDLTESPMAPGEADVDISFEDEDEQPPASSKRSRVPSSMDQALADAAAQQEAEREAPLKTPPPESGPQEAPVVVPAASHVDSLMGEELEIPTRAASFASPVAEPTPEQLGQTIDLEEARGPTLELAVPVESSVPPAGDDLEVALPPRDVVGGYDDSLMPPPQALEELEAHRRRQDDDFAPPPESLAQLPSVQPGAPQAEIVPIEAAPEIVPVPVVPLGPEVVLRAAPAGEAQSIISVREHFRPASFLELLDASLGLGGS